MGKSWSSRVSEFLGVALLLAMLFSSRPASAQSAPAGKTVSPNQGADTLRARTLRMEQALSQLATENAGSGGMTAVALAVGAAYTGIGVFAALNTQEEPRDSVFRGLAVTESLVIGGIFLGVGFHGLLPGPTMDVHRLARFQHDVRAGRMSATRLAQYEGELYTGALGARISRRTTGWMYMGAALAGSGLIVLAATSDMRGAAKELTYVEGAVLTPLCAILGVLRWTNESAREREWRRYRLGQSRAPVARLAVFPSLTAGGMLVVTGGIF